MIGDAGWSKRRRGISSGLIVAPRDFCLRFVAPRDLALPPLDGRAGLCFAIVRSSPSWERAPAFAGSLPFELNTRHQSFARAYFGQGLFKLRNPGLQIADQQVAEIGLLKVARHGLGLPSGVELS